MAQRVNSFLQTLLDEITDEDSSQDNYEFEWSSDEGVPLYGYIHGGSISPSLGVSETDIDSASETETVSDESMIGGFCSICQSSIHKHCVEFCHAPCGHTFHYYCLTKWLMDFEHASCTLCRQPIPDFSVLLHHQRCETCYDHPRIRDIQKATQYIFWVNTQELYKKLYK